MKFYCFKFYFPKLLIFRVNMIYFYPKKYSCTKIPKRSVVEYFYNMSVLAVKKVILQKIVHIFITWLTIHINESITYCIVVILAFYKNHNSEPVLTIFVKFGIMSVLSIKSNFPPCCWLSELRITNLSRTKDSIISSIVPKLLAQ